MSRQGFFITGTDTGVGKTWVTVALMRFLRRQGYNVAGMKPVAAGCRWLDGQWKNEDALLIQQNASLPLAYNQVNPYAFELPVSPHIAAAGAEIDVCLLNKIFNDTKRQADMVLVEGAGGWFSPLGDEISNAALAETLRLPVIIVVGVKLGCINHALLTWRAVDAATVSCAGWVAVQTDADMPFFEKNIDFLRDRLKVPLLGVLPHVCTADFDKLSHYFNGNLLKD